MKNKTIVKNNIIIFGLYVLFSYPLFYYSYKFSTPDFGGKDYYDYLHLYSNWEFEKVESPFNMRLISAFFIFLFNKIGFFYDTETVFKAIYPEMDQKVFFNAILFNYLCVIFTSFMIYYTSSNFFQNSFYAFLAGCLYLLGHGTIFFSLKPLSESMGILLVSISFYFYLKKSYKILLFLLISVFQREYIFIIFVIISIVNFFFENHKYHVHVFISSILLFFLYYYLRKTIFFTPQYDYQTLPTTFLNSLLHPKIDMSFIKQSILLSNLLVFYGITVIYKKIMKLQININFLINIIFLLAQVIIMSIMAQFGNNAGRYFYYTTPILIYYLFWELKPILNKYLVFKT